MTNPRDLLQRALPDAKVETMLTDEQISHMVNRFLMWRLPERFRPDDGISFDPISSRGTKYERRREPTGTNLFDAEQATAMVRHMVEGLPAAAPLAKAPDAKGEETVDGWQPTHRHKVRGVHVRVLFEATGQFVLHDPRNPVYDDKPFIVYEHENGSRWIRPREEFNDGRFELIAAVRPKAAAPPPSPIEPDKTKPGDPELLPHDVVLEAERTPRPTAEGGKATNAEVSAASNAVMAEWQAMIQEQRGLMSAADIARAFVSPTNHRLIRAALDTVLSRRPSPSPDLLKMAVKALEPFAKLSRALSLNHLNRDEADVLFVRLGEVNLAAEAHAALTKAMGGKADG